MNTNEGIKYYAPLEEKINIISHVIGLCLSIAALVMLVIRSSMHGTAIHVVSFTTFGAGLVVLYAASSIYHSSTRPLLRARMRIVDHASIYVLIAGTYTPFTLVTLNGVIGWTIFGITWAMALTGITLKLFYTGKYSVVSTLMYVFMGWMIVFAIDPLVENLHADGLFWLVMGGVAYTLGAVLYGIKQLKFNHAVFHLFVLFGSACHFVSVYFYIMPET